jgi:hypothetical protein
MSQMREQQEQEKKEQVTYLVPSEIDPTKMVDSRTPEWERTRLKYANCTPEQIMDLFRARNSAHIAFNHSTLGLPQVPRAATRDNRNKPAGKTTAARPAAKVNSKGPQN